jgi:signal transduction histidine kinase
MRENKEKVNILLVDNDPVRLLFYEAILADLGENLIKARTASEAIEQLLKADIAVVLLDVNLAGQGGFELPDMIRQHPQLENVAVIFVSASRLTALDQIQGYEHGAEDYILVPVIPDLLRAKVKVFVELYRKTQQLHDLNREMQQLSRRIMRLQDEERRRIARELHDGLGQELTVAKLTADSIQKTNNLPPQAKEKIAELAERITDAIKQVRSLSHLLHPPLLDEVGLSSALQLYVEGLTKRSGIETFIDLQPADFPRLAPEVEIAIFRIIQEGLVNVFRHSEAHHAWVALLFEDNKVVLRVRDDGKGITRRVATMEPGTVGVGISGMSQRVKEFGGELRLKNADPGTLIEAFIPIKAGAATSDSRAC